MPLYDKPVRVLMIEDMVKDLGLTKGQIFSKEQVLSWFAKKYSRIKEGTISAHLIRFSTNASSRMHYNAKPGKDDVFFQLDPTHFRLYDAASDPSPIYEKPGGHVPVPAPEDGTLEPPSEFAYEEDLRNFLLKNLSIIESGLQLYEDEGITGRQFPVGGRFVDILATDTQHSLVVVELKVSRGYDRVVGQLLRYMAWIAKHQADPGQKVRGIIVAREISEDLILACSALPTVQLYEYDMSVTVRRVDNTQ
jgi:endonuclease